MDSLGVGLAGRLQGVFVVLNGLKHLGVPVGRLDEAGPFALKNCFCSSHGGVDEGSDFETGTKLVFETEGVAGGVRFVV